MSVEEIAVMQSVSPVVVQASIDYMEEYKYSFSNENLALKVVEVALDQMSGLNTVFKEGMRAKKVVYTNPKNGKQTMAADHAMRLKTAETVRSFIETVQPKAPGVQLNQQFNNQNSPGGTSYGGMSFEAILRKKREQRGLANDQQQVIDAEVSVEDELEDEFADFGGDEDGEGDDEE